MKKELQQQQKTQPWQIPPVLSFYLKHPLYLILTCPNSLFSKAQTKCNCLLKIFCWFFQPKRDSSSPRWPQHVVWSLLKVLPISETALHRREALPESHIPAEGSRFLFTFDFLVTHRFIHLRQPSIVVKMKTWAQKFDMRDTNPNCTAYWLLLAVWSWLSHFTSLNLGSLIFNRQYAALITVPTSRVILMTKWVNLCKALWKFSEML